LALVGVLLARSGTVGAQGVNVQIEELDCEGNPEVIVVRNLGDQEVSLTGWNLQSDPISRESLPLASLGGVLAPGQSILVESGPTAAAAIVWSRDFVFRDNDPTDFAQLASDAGDVLLKVNCGSLAQTTATPDTTPAPTRQATPVPTALTAADVPVGGGPPAAAGGAISPAVMIIAGSWLLAVGMATFAFPWLRRGARSEEPEPAEPPAPKQALTPTLPDQPLPSDGENPLRPYLSLAVIVLASVALLVFLLQFGEKKRE
jgi:hypothetical protein